MMHLIVELVHAIDAHPDRAHAILREFSTRHTFPLLNGESAIFFFWDEHPADAVYLVHWVNGLDSRQAFHRIGNTDAFFLPVDLPLTGRIEYKLDIHRGGKRFWVRDPGNPFRARDPFGSNSVCQMPGYTEPRWIYPEPDSRQGSLEQFSFHSDAWNEMSEVTVYLPNEYKPTKRYPLVICHDGDDYLRFTHIKTVLDNLISRNEVLPLIMAFTNGGPGRNGRYGANATQAKFLVEELLPQVESRYGISDDPRERGLMGASFGGVSSLYTAWHYPGVFRKLLLQSGSFVFTDVGDHGRGELWNPVVDFVNDFRKDPGRIDAQVYMSAGHFESLITYNRHLAPLMRAAGLRVRFEESADGHNWVAWRDRLREGLTYLFTGHLWMTYE